MFRIDEVGLNVIRRITDLWNASQSKSYADYVAITRIEPITLVDSDLINYKHTEMVLKTLVNIFASYYLRAWTIATGLGFNSIEIRRNLDRLNPNRSALKSGVDAAGWVMSAENANLLRLSGPSLTASLEAIRAEIPNFQLNDEPTSGNMTVGRDTVTNLKELVSLAVGKELALNIRDGDNEATIMANVRLMTTNIPTPDLVRLLGHAGQLTGWKERMIGWQTGRLEFIRDICLCQDLISEHRKNLNADRSGIMKKILSRRRSNKLASIFSANPSIATASNIAVISTDTARMLEDQLSGKLDDFSTREKVFDDTYLMLMVVVDKQWERCTIYTQGTDMAQDISFIEMKGSNKDGPDIMEALKAYRAGQGQVSF